VVEVGRATEQKIGSILDAAEQQDASDVFLQENEVPRLKINEPTGLVLATELMIGNLGIEACIRERRLSQIPGLIQIGAADGMHTVDDSLIELLLAERISLMDAMAHARDPNFVKEEFQKALKTQRKGWFAGIFRK